MSELIDYGAERFARQTWNGEGSVPDLHGSEPVRWIMWNAPADETALRAAVAGWGLHPHIATDLLDSQARANLEEYPDHLYLDLDVVVPQPNETLKFEQVGLVLHAQGLLTLCQPGLFAEVLDRIEVKRGLVRGKGPDYLFIRLIDAALKPYEVQLDHLEGVLDELETEVVHRPSQRIVVKILRVKRQISLLRRHVAPLREVVNSLETSTHGIIKRENRPYLRDTKGKVQALYERLEAQRSLLESLESLYLSSVGQRTNEVMRILTVFSAVFMPLTFIVGVYGMNFEWMPELAWDWGYPSVWILMSVVAGSMVWWMRQKRFW
ncbi:MAG: magnesium transport protein CorA [Bacteroidota bacterium]|jgi:magnesium transporter